MSTNPEVILLLIVEKQREVKVRKMLSECRLSLCLLQFIRGNKVVKRVEFIGRNVIEAFRYLLLELDFVYTFVKSFHWSSISQAYTRGLHAQDFPRMMATDVYYIVY